MEKIFDLTKSICPVCRNILPARIYFKNGKTIMEKECPKHGKFTALHFWDSEKLYRLIDSAYKEEKEIICSSPLDCEKCNKHSVFSTQLGIFMTKKCNLNCPFCCLKRFKVSIDELNMDDIKKIAKTHSEKKLISLGAAEVTMRKDLFNN